MGYARYTQLEYVLLDIDLRLVDTFAKTIYACGFVMIRFQGGRCGQRFEILGENPTMCSLCHQQTNFQTKFRLVYKLIYLLSIFVSKSSEIMPKPTDV